MVGAPDDRPAVTRREALKLSLHDAASIDTAATKASLEAAGLEVACSRGLAFDADISSEDTAVVARGAELLRSSLHVTHDIGGTILTGALYTAMFHALADIDYTGGITFESFSTTVVSPTLSNDLSIWRNLWNDGPALARHAHSFMTNALEGTRDYS